MGKPTKTNKSMLHRRRYLQMLGLGAGAAVGSLEATALGVDPAKAATTDDAYRPSGAGVVVDSFEDGKLGEYNIDDSEGGKARVSGSFSFFGEKSLSLADSVFLSSESGLERYPSQGDNTRFRFRPATSDSHFKFLYGYKDRGNKYRLSVDAAEDILRLTVSESSNTFPPETDYVVLAENSGGFDISSAEWYKIEIDWSSDGIHSVNLLDINDGVLSHMSGSDSRFSEGGIAFSNKTGEVHIDSVVINSFDDYLYQMVSSHGGVRSCTIDEIPSNTLLAHYQVFCEFEDGIEYQYSQEIYEDLRVRYSDSSGDYWGAATERGTKYKQDQLDRDMGLETMGGA